MHGYAVYYPNEDGDRAIADIAGMPEQTEEAAVGRKRRTGGYHGRTEVA